MPNPTTSTTLATAAPTTAPTPVTASDTEPAIASAAIPPTKAATDAKNMNMTSPNRPPRPRTAAQVTIPNMMPSGSENSSDMCTSLGTGPEPDPRQPPTAENNSAR